MTKNQKIALGCGGAGCLGLIFIVVVGVVIYFVQRRSTGSVFDNSNVSTNRNDNANTDSNANANTSADSNSNSSSTTSVSSMSDDDRHKIYQAAAMTGDPEMIRRVSVKLGLMNEDYTPGDQYLSFVKDHVVWGYRNAEFIQSLDTKEKAVAYVNEHFPD
ncbi:MAG TPA: hypothetical protein VGQ39_23765 [Pyrinomonadaceae bacterium]|jgi:hypothetical protein|nr:hypothetical protein [Pyrinomonadaceae bacterium]